MVANWLEWDLVLGAPLQEAEALQEGLAGVAELDVLSLDLYNILQTSVFLKLRSRCTCRTCPAPKFPMW